MSSSKYGFSPRQIIFREMVLGTLVYSVVLGFFNDYTDILSTKSYSTTFLVAIVMQLLTYLTLRFKKRVSVRFKSSVTPLSKLGHVLSVWLILFLSKFVFLAVIDFVFGQAVSISGFVGLLLIIITMTAAKELTDYVFDKLAE